MTNMATVLAGRPVVASTSSGKDPAACRIDDILPVFRFGTAPQHLKTRRQLAAEGLKSGGPVRGRITWRNGRRWADVYARDDAQPKRPLSDRQTEAIARRRAARAAQREAEEQARFAAAEACEREREEELRAMLDRDRAEAVRQAQEWLALGDAAAILDTETTDLNGYIVEIAVLSMRGEPLFSCLVNPLVPIEPGAQRVHGLTDADVASAPNFSDIWPEIARLLQGRRVVAFGAVFDQETLVRELWRLFPDIRDAKTVAPWIASENWLCAKYLYAEFAGFWNARFGSYRWLPLPDADHRALEDCRALLRLLDLIAKDPGQAMQSERLSHD
jgi:DNA polymerase III epsilon subunit-like protein